MSDDLDRNPWRSVGLILIGALIGYMVGRFAFTTVESVDKPKEKEPDPQEEVVQPEPPKIQEISVDDDPYIGSNTAPVVIIDFSDYQCPFCKKFYSNIYPNLKKDFIDTGKVKYVYRDFPLNIHQAAIGAAVAANCAGDQGKYWEMHNKIYDTQEEWSKAENLSEVFSGYAKEIGIYTATFKTCFESDRYTQEVTKDKEDGKSYGVRGTPTLFVNGEILRGVPQSYDSFKEYLEDEFGL
ncbi:DsbA family protein [Patescibacteria group bacterium]